MLYLPLPYMAFLDRAQVSAVIAHELGHFTGEDTGYSLRFAPIYRSFLDSIFSITNEHDEKDDGSRVWVAAPVTLYGKWFLASFEEAMHHWSRERELAADARQPHRRHGIVRAGAAAHFRAAPDRGRGAGAQPAGAGSAAAC